MARARGRGEGSSLGAREGDRSRGGTRSDAVDGLPGWSGSGGVVRPVEGGAMDGPRLGADRGGCGPAGPQIKRVICRGSAAPSVSTREDLQGICRASSQIA